VDLAHLLERPSAGEGVGNASPEGALRQVALAQRVNRWFLVSHLVACLIDQGATLLVAG
jgi:hypothetical protein